MKKAFFSLLALAGGCTIAHAQQVSAEQAAQTARNFMQQNAGTMQHAPSRINPSLAYTAQIGSEVQFYVFNNDDTRADNGFVIVGGDKRARQILGYCEHGSFDYESAPENFKWWLSQYQQQIHTAIKQKAIVKNQEQLATRAALGNTKATIQNLITTKWNQSAPYNNECKKPGPGAKGGELVTGCVATAMAQVMKYWKTPASYGSGSIMYNTGSLNYNVSVNFNEEGYYDWNNMPDRYTNGSYTDTQAAAVAKLMYHAGASVEMDYNDSDSGGSGASSIKIPAAMSKYFGYDKSALCINRNYYSDEEWEEMVYSELAAGHPLLYGGQSTNGGHEFVCHGYDASNGFYAFNWGWGGNSDGYYPLTGTGALQPNSSGIGGAGTGAAYTGSQDIIYGLQPDNGGNYIIQIVSLSSPRLVAAGGAVCENINVDLSNEAQTAAVHRLCYEPWNQSAKTYSFQTTVMLRDVVSGECFFSDAITDVTNLQVAYYKKQAFYQFSAKNLIYNGIYEVLPAYRETSSDKWQFMRVPVTSTIPTLTVTGGLDPTAVDVTFSIASNSVAERGTLQIMHDEYYKGHVTYTSDDTSIATVSEDGVITGVKAGTTTIHVEGDATTYYNTTKKDFTITVTPYVKLDVPFEISDTEVLVGKTLQITWPNDYAGTLTFSSSDANVASVDANGVITAKAAGTADIIAMAEGNDDYNQTSQTFTITVKQPGIELVSYEVTNHGNFTTNTVKIVISVKNMTGTTFNSAHFIRVSAFIDGIGTYTLGNALYPWENKETITLCYDFSNNWPTNFINYENKSGTFTIYDEDRVTQIGDPISFNICEPLTHEYKLTSAGWGTLCLPFESEVPEGLAAYECNSASSNVLNFSQVEKMEMNTPYIISGTPDTYEFSGPKTPGESTYTHGLLTGVMVPDFGMQEGSYVMQMNKGAVGFYPIPESLRGKAATQYRAFLTPQTTASLRGVALAFPSDITAIETINTESSQPEGIYDLSGNLIETLRPGFNIIRQADGSSMKVFVK